MTPASILVVDDEATIRKFLARVLERAGYVVQAASNAQEALQYLDSYRFELMLTDIKMDRVDGVALLSEARARYPELAVILLTGHATVQSAVAALREGAYDYLLKPVRNEEIVAAVQQALEKHAHQRARERLEAIATEMAAVLHTREITQPENDFTPPRIIQRGELMIDFNLFTAWLAGRKLHLTPTEFRLLMKLAQSPGMVFDFVTLVYAACGYNCSHNEAREIIGTHVLNLRQKLGVEPDMPLYIESVRGVGYRLIPSTDDN